MDQELEPNLVADLKQLDVSINHDEDRALRARWNYGRRILEFYLPPGSTRKQLPKGELDKLASELGVCRSEVGARMKFYKTYPTEQKLSTIIERYRSWSAIKQGALTDTTPCRGHRQQHAGRSRTAAPDASVERRVAAADR